MTTTTINLTAASIDTFLAYAKDAANWSGSPWVSQGNVTCTKETRGNLSDLVKKGLIRIGHDDTDGYVEFTAEGEKLAAAYGISLR